MRPPLSIIAMQQSHGCAVSGARSLTEHGAAAVIGHECPCAVSHTSLPQLPHTVAAAAKLALRRTDSASEATVERSGCYGKLCWKRRSVPHLSCWLCAWVGPCDRSSSISVGGEPGIALKSTTSCALTLSLKTGQLSTSPPAKQGLLSQLSVRYRLERSAAQTHAPSRQR